MWVWQSQAPAGTSKFTGLDGWDAFAYAVRLGMVTPAASEASRIPRLVSIGSLPVFSWFSFALRDRMARPTSATHAPRGSGRHCLQPPLRTAGVSRPQARSARRAQGEALRDRTATSCFPIREAGAASGCRPDPEFP